MDATGCSLDKWLCQGRVPDRDLSCATSQVGESVPKRVTLMHVLGRMEKKKSNLNSSIMQRKTVLASLINVVCGALLVSGAIVQAQAAEEKKADATGTWTWSTPGRQGGPDRTNTLTLKVEGDKITGKLSQPAFRGGGEPIVTEIKDGKLKGDEISFSVTREFNGNSFTTKYSGKISGDTIKGKIQMPERGGQTPEPRDWEAKRVAEKK